MKTFFRFDESFEMVLPEDTNLERTYLLLTVKDKCLMGEGIFLGESLLPLKNIQRSNSNINFQVGLISSLSNYWPLKKGKSVENRDRVL